MYGLRSNQKLVKNSLMPMYHDVLTASLAIQEDSVVTSSLFSYFILCETKAKHGKNVAISRLLVLHWHRKRMTTANNTVSRTLQTG